MEAEKDIVFAICQQMLNNSPEASFKRLNPALRNTLDNCIEADLPFLPDTFQRIYNDLRGNWWFGDGAGSSIGEGFYGTACGCNHASAQQSFETFAGRPGALWEEDIKYPFRLHVGSRFTWRGHFVTVTSMRTDSLVACSYKDVQRIDGLKAGAPIGYSPEHLITSAKKEGTSIVLRVVKAPKSHGTGEVAKRFTISYADIAATRRTAKARLKVMLEKIANCDPKKDADKLTKEINTEHFRHFELEDIRSAFQRRKEWAASEGKIEAWRKGKDGAWLDVKLTLIRINQDRVECSNGNSISKAAAVAVLPVLLEHRKNSAALNLPLDSYRIDRVSQAGVEIGCTIVPWLEIERLIPELLAA